MSLERVNLMLDRSKIKLMKKTAIKKGLPLSVACSASALVRTLIDDFINDKSV